MAASPCSPLQGDSAGWGDPNLAATSSVAIHLEMQHPQVPLPAPLTGPCPHAHPTLLSESCKKHRPGPGIPLHVWTAPVPPIAPHALGLGVLLVPCKAAVPSALT